MNKDKLNANIALQKELIEVMEKQISALEDRKRVLVSLGVTSFIPKKPQSDFEESMGYISTIKEITLLSIDEAICKKRLAIDGMNANIEATELERDAMNKK